MNIASKNFWIYPMAAFYIFAGTYHFINPKFYAAIMPPYLPYPALMLKLSGIAEIIGGALLLYPPFRKMGAWLIIVILIAVFPANIQMSINQYQVHGLLYYLSLIRLPFQFLFIWWAYLYTKK